MAEVDPEPAVEPGKQAHLPLPDRIPVFFLSGFLGSGKSTLLNELLNDPAFHDTAVIINEFGDVPVDHLLVRRGETTINQVSTGCLCCSGTTDIQTTLSDLHSAAKSDPTIRFSRVIVEMSGLGDPAPLVNALSARRTGNGAPEEAAALEVFHLAGFVTLYDIMTGATSVEHHFEALKQVAFADRIVLTKTDLAEAQQDPANVEALREDLRDLNASAEIIDRRAANLPDLFSPRPYSTVDRGEDVVGWLALEAALANEADHGPQSRALQSRHGPGIRTFSIVSDQPLPKQRFRRFLSILQQSAGQRLLRVKGIVASDEDPDRPLIVHAVQHILSDPVRLDAWPGEDRRTRLVFITSDIDPEPVRALFAAAINQAPFSLIEFFMRQGNALSAFFKPKRNNLTKSPRRVP